MAVDNLTQLQIEITDLHRQVDKLTALNRLWLRLGIGQDFQQFLDELLSAALEFVACDTALILLPDSRRASLSVKSASVSTDMMLAR
jgi:hypothetical protein